MGRAMDAGLHRVDAVRGRAAGDRLPGARRPFSRACAVGRLRSRLRAYAIGAGTPIAVFLVVWFFAVNLLSPGDPSPLPYVPLANPLDVTLALALWASATWAKRFETLPERALVQWVGAGLFVALNGVVLRTAHHWIDVPWRWSSLLASKPLQAALTLTWTLTALTAMVAATRRRRRLLWMLGAGLLAAVVAKLFLVDLSNLSGLPRVVAFLGAGVLLLVIGFVSPLPPAASETPSSGGAAPASRDASSNEIAPSPLRDSDPPAT